MKLHPPVHLFLSGSSLAFGHPYRLGGCRCHATMEGLLNKSLGDPNHLWSILVLGPKKLHFGVTFLSLVHHIVGCCGCSKYGALVEELHMSIANSHGRAYHIQGNYTPSSLVVP